MGEIGRVTYIPGGFIYDRGLQFQRKFNLRMRPSDSMSKGMLLDSLVPGRRCSSNSASVIPEHMLRSKFMGTSCETCSHVNATEHLSWKVNLGSGYHLVPSGNKPLSEPMVGPDLCRRIGPQGHGVLTYTYHWKYQYVFISRKCVGFWLNWQYQTRTRIRYIFPCGCQLGSQSTSTTQGPPLWVPKSWRCRRRGKVSNTCSGLFRRHRKCCHRVLIV